MSSISDGDFFDANGARPDGNVSWEALPSGHPIRRAHWVGGWLCGGEVAAVPCPLLRKEFVLGESPKRAVLHITALGLCEAEINGERVGDDVFVPGWTDYRKRVVVRSYDVTGSLRAGLNALGILLGDGWYCGALGWFGRRNYGDRPLARACLAVEYEGGLTEEIPTKGDWKVTTGPILQADLLHGEEYDARLEHEGWSEPGFDDSGWLAASTGAAPVDPELCGSPGPPVRRMGELSPLLLSRNLGAGGDTWTYDFRQNFSGRARVKVRAARGVCLRLRFAEMLDTDGTLYTANLRAARCTDAYTCKGTGEETWEPRFTFHGFRYMTVESFDGNRVESLEVEGVVLYSDMEETGHFRCSHDLLNRLMDNITWGARGNFLEVPTDCPQRDERLGWTGDAQVFARTACFLLDTRGFFAKWMRDFRDAQTTSGSIPRVIPEPHRLTPRRHDDGGPAWSDANVIIPYTVYLCYGDRGILEDHYDCMSRYLRHLVTDCSKDFIRSHPEIDGWLGYGDWLAMDGSGLTQGGTPKDLIGTAFLALDAKIMEDVARILGRDGDCQEFGELRRRVVQAFQARFFTTDGRVVTGTQTACALALHFGLVPADHRSKVAAQLVKDIEERDYHLSTGFVGTPYLLDALEGIGRLDLAYRLLERDTFPSWLFPVTVGATTIWERWNGWTPTDGFADSRMNSFNHYAYGAVGDWMVRTVAGLDLDPARPGYLHVVFRPRPGGTLTWAEASIKTLRGDASIHWELKNKSLEIRMEVPTGSHATFFPPPGFSETTPIHLGPGKHELNLPPDQT